MNFTLQFPTRLHEQVAETAYAFFHAQPAVDTVLVTNSCARGQAVRESDLDMHILVRPDTPEAEMARLEAEFKRSIAASPLLREFLQLGRFVHLHLDVSKGQFTPEVWDDGG